MENNRDEIDILDLLYILWDKKWIILICVIIGALIGIVYTKFIITPKYESNVTLILSKPLSIIGKLDDELDSITQTDILLNQNLISTYEEIVKSKTIANEVIKNLNLNMKYEELKNCVKVSSVDNTEFMKISITTNDPVLSMNIANEMEKVFAKKIVTVYNIQNISVIDYAQANNVPVNINPVKNALIFGTGAGVLIVMIIFLIKFFDTTITSSEDVEKHTKLFVLSNIPKHDSDVKSRLSIYNSPKSQIAEALRTLRTNVQYLLNEQKICLVTSSHSGEGKSYIASNLAATFAIKGKRVLLIDADMRRGMQRNIFRITEEYGLSDYLTGIRRKEEIIFNTYVDNLDIIVSGVFPQNPAELLENARMKNLLSQVRDEYDIVIVDGPPILVVADSIIISTYVDSTIVVTASNETKKAELIDVKKALNTVESPILGVVINKVDVKSYGYYKYNRYGMYGKTNTYDKYSCYYEDDIRFKDIPNKRRARR